MFGLGGTEIIIILVIGLVLFGAKKASATSVAISKIP
jgi:Sec-independent protein translocase protein TatA